MPCLKQVRRVKTMPQEYKYKDHNSWLNDPMPVEKIEPGHLYLGHGDAFGNFAVCLQNSRELTFCGLVGGSKAIGSNLRVRARDYKLAKENYRFFTPFAEVGIAPQKNNEDYFATWLRSAEIARLRRTLASIPPAEGQSKDERYLDEYVRNYLQLLISISPELA